MLAVDWVRLSTDKPIVGCEIMPLIFFRQPNGKIVTEDRLEPALLDGYFVRYKWYRDQSEKLFATCSVHPFEKATLQCLGCLKAKIPVTKSYHCSSKCFSDAWPHHRVLHERAANEDEERLGQLNISRSGVSNVSPAASSQTAGVEALYEVGRSKTYAPTDGDIGCRLKCECFLVYALTKAPAGHPISSLTPRVIPAPAPRSRKLIPVCGVDGVSDFNAEEKMASSVAFSVLSYNILSQVFATSERYSYCPSWALSWSYRRQNLLKEIVGYKPDILCLQEVESDHFEDFFAPELAKHGYLGLHKRKTNQVYDGRIYINQTDGCAIFFRRDKFAYVKKYEFEFNRAAQHLADTKIPDCRKKTVLNRLSTGNIALIVVLEAKFVNQSGDPGNTHFLCVANTHVSVPQELKDVIIWQVHTLLKTLETIAEIAGIPMLLCGDLSSLPGSAAHSILATRKVDELHPDLMVGALPIYDPPHKLVHQLPLVSAYSSFVRGAGPTLEHQRQIMDPKTSEPLFTNYTRDIIRTTDYIFYTEDTLTVESLLELLDEYTLRKDTALPSPLYSSDHIALLAEFFINLRRKPRTTR